MTKVVTEEAILSKLSELLEHDIFSDRKYRLTMHKIFIRYKDCINKHSISDPWIHFEFKTSVEEDEGDYSSVLEFSKDLHHAMYNDLSNTQIYKFNYLLMKFVEYFSSHDGYPRFLIKVFEFDADRKSSKQPNDEVISGANEVDAFFSSVTTPDSNMRSLDVNEHHCEFKRLVGHYRKIKLSPEIMCKIKNYFEILGEDNEAQVWSNVKPK
jgi:hypothetical protein